MEEVAFEVRTIMCALTQEYIDLQNIYGDVINRFTAIYDISSAERFALGDTFSRSMNFALWIAIGANVMFFEAARVKNIISSRTVDAAASKSESMMMCLSEAKVRAKELDDLLISYEQNTNIVISKIRADLTEYVTKPGDVEVSDVVKKGVDEIINAINTYLSSDALTESTEKCFSEAYSVLQEEYGETINVTWRVASQFYGNYVSVSAMVYKPAAGSVH